MCTQIGCSKPEAENLFVMELARNADVPHGLAVAQSASGLCRQHAGEWVGAIVRGQRRRRGQTYSAATTANGRGAAHSSAEAVARAKAALAASDAFLASWDNQRGRRSVPQRRQPQRTAWRYDEVLRRYVPDTRDPLTPMGRALLLGDVPLERLAR
jgi:hypothetical protein